MKQRELPATLEALINRHGLCATKDGDLYRSHLVGWMLKAYEAALASPEVQALRKDIAECVHIAAEQATEIQELLSLLKESRQQLPMAAQFWNEDDDRARASVFVDRVMGLIAKIDAAMEKQK